MTLKAKKGETTCLTTVEATRREVDRRDPDGSSIPLRYSKWDRVFPRKICNLCLADGLTPAGNTSRRTQATLISSLAPIELIPSASPPRKLRTASRRWVPRAETEWSSTSQSSKHPTTDSSTQMPPKTWSHGNSDSPTPTSDRIRLRSRRRRKTTSCFNGLVVSTREPTSTREKIHSDSGPRSSSTTEQQSCAYRLCNYSYSSEVSIVSGPIPGLIS